MNDSRPRICVIEDDYLIRWSLKEELQAKGYDVCDADSIAAGRTCIGATMPDLMVLDEHLPDGEGTGWLAEIVNLPNPPAIVMLTAEDDVNTVVRAVKSGVAEYITKPYEIAHVLKVVESVLEKTAYERKLRTASHTLQSDIALGGLIGSSREMKTVFEQIRKFAVAEKTPVLVRGESGTGKEITARMLHKLSPRCEAPFLTINCSTIPADLAESELFGHERGSFTSAHQERKGMFELADHGTLFLDEVGELPLPLQAKLLRVLEDGTFRRVGGTKELQSDVRVISATNSPLEKRIQEKQFREDLYYRLCVTTITLPPLVGRNGDVELLTEHFLMNLRARYNKQCFTLTEKGLLRLRANRWPGNVRQLRNILERAVVLGDTSLDILAEDGFVQPNGNGAENGGSLTDMERQAIVRALEENDQNQTRAAKALGISRDTLRYRMKKFGLGKG